MMIILVLYFNLQQVGGARVLLGGRNVRRRLDRHRNHHRTHLLSPDAAARLASGFCFRNAGLVAENLERLVRMMKLKRINIGDKYSFYSAFVFEDVFENEIDKLKFTQGSIKYLQKLVANIIQDA